VSLLILTSPVRVREADRDTRGEVIIVDERDDDERCFLSPSDDRILELWLRLAALSPAQLRRFARRVGVNLGEN
jgi:bifunctional DNA-binding transcriptional regulator/antitoxin component of YhaV-PrlF toxin-antitoxin module